MPDPRPPSPRRGRSEAAARQDPLARGDRNAPRGDRRPPKGDRRPPEKPDALRPLTAQRQLDLDKPAHEDLSPAEVQEMGEHLAFLRQWRAALRLSLNSAEDLLVNGARPPTDRGQCRHLLSKVDRKVIDGALGREPLKSDAPLRTRFLAGVVRLRPDLPTLLGYLEALSAVADRQDASAAFSLTIERIDFAEVSPAHMATLLEVIERTFQGHERVQVVFSLLGSASFAKALDAALVRLPPALAEVFGPLRTVHRCVLRRGRPPESAREQDDLEKGVDMLLSAPEKLLRGYSAETRARLAEYAVEDPPTAPGARTTAGRALLDSLRTDPSWPALALRRVDRLLAAGEDERAKGLLQQIATAHPDFVPAKTRITALGWPRVGPLAVESTRPARLVRGFWLERACPIRARTLPTETAAQLARETDLQRRLPATVTLAVLGASAPAAGGAPGEAAWVALSPEGEPVDGGRIQRLPLPGLLAWSLSVSRLLLEAARVGCLLPDVPAWRFVADPPLPDAAPAHVRLASLDRATVTSTDDCLAAHAVLAGRLWRSLLANHRPLPGRGLPVPLASRLQRATTLPDLCAVLAEAVAVLDGAATPATAPSNPAAR